MSSRTRPSCWLACSTAMLSIYWGIVHGVEKLLVYEYVANETLDKLLFSFEVCRRFMLGLLVLLPWCLLMAMVLSISLCSTCFRSKWSN
ncbi:hypothetical protein CsSME_00048847 [Camellia sinensis var. sinensis]